MLKNAPSHSLYLDQDQKIIRSSPGKGIKNKFMVVKTKLRQKHKVCVLKEMSFVVEIRFVVEMVSVC